MKTIVDGEGSKEDDDRISSLPDDILHEILDRVGCQYQCAEAALVSKRWNHLWLSYPSLEFDGNDYTNGSPPRSTMKSFIAAATRKFSSSSGLNYIKSVRIVSRDSAFIEAILDLIQSREPEEISMSLRSSDSVIPTLLLNSSRLRTLKLVFCKLLEQDQYKMINLRMIHLFSVSINNRALNSMIAAAPLLEKLTLVNIDSIKRVEVCNNANLKHLQIKHIFMKRTYEIVLVGALDSLETLSLSLLNCHDMEMICSSLVLPSLKSLEIRDCRDLRDRAVNKLISRCPSLLSLRLVRLINPKELKIESSTLEKLELRNWDSWSLNRVMMLHIDAPRLVNFRFSGEFYSLHKISDATTNSIQAAQIRLSTFELSLSCCYIDHQYFRELKEFLRKVTRQFQFVELQLHDFGKGLIGSDQVEDDSPTPVIEHVEVKFQLSRELLDQTFLYKMLESCHPKYFSLCRDVLADIHPYIKVSL
ncbi:F-box protein At5g03100 [Linum perenne]